MIVSIAKKNVLFTLFKQLFDTVCHRSNYLFNYSTLIQILSIANKMDDKKDIFFMQKPMTNVCRNEQKKSIFHSSTTDWSDLVFFRYS